MIGALKSTSEVVACDVMSGEFDLVVRVEAGTADRIREVSQAISSLSGVRDTLTAFALSSMIKRCAELRQPEWSALALMESPDIVRRVDDEFIVAGADVITTNSYALVPFHIGETRFREEGRRLIALAGHLAREAADAAGEGRVRVAGSLPPIFGSYEPHLFEPARVQDYLSVLVEELDSSVDVFLGETLSLIAEAGAVEQAVAGTGKPFWISFTL